MERGEYRPEVKEAAFDAGLPQAGNDQTGSVPNPFDALIEQQRLNLGTIDEYSDMWQGLTTLTIHSPIAAEIRIPVTPELHEMIGHISNGLDFVLFEKVSAEKRGDILREQRELAEIQREEGMSELILTYEEGLILRKAAAAVNIEYDPGTSEEIEKRTFKIADLEAKAQGLDVVMPYWTNFTTDQ